MAEEMKIKLGKPLAGKILDLGGGGEGVIGQVYRQQVVAIDRCQAELDEAPATCTKMLMDATALHFEACKFDHVTAFYSLMYMTTEEQTKAIQEAYRVLKWGGALHIWDTAISSAYPAPFTVSLAVDINGATVHTTYGIVKKEGQDLGRFVSICRQAGMALSEKTIHNNQFYLQFRKLPPKIAGCSGG